MPPVFPSGQFPPGAADRYAPSGLPFPPLRGGPLLVKPRTATPVRRPGRQSWRETRHSRTGVLHQVNATGDTCVDMWR